MAGSIKNFVYTDDVGQTYGITLDESNTEAINGTDGDLPTGSTSTVTVPRNIKVREVFYADAARNRTIRCVPLTPTAYTNILNGTGPQTIPDLLGEENATLDLVRANGERRRILFGADTGLTDGDAT